MACLLWRVRNNIEVIPSYIHTYRNLSADLITRAGRQKMGERMERFPTTPISLPWRWRDFCRMVYKVKWPLLQSSQAPRCVPYSIQWAPNLAVVEWGGFRNFPDLRDISLNPGDEKRTGYQNGAVGINWMSSLVLTLHLWNVLNSHPSSQIAESKSQHHCDSVRITTYRSEKRRLGSGSMDGRGKSGRLDPWCAVCVYSRPYAYRLVESPYGKLAPDHIQRCLRSLPVSPLFGWEMRLYSSPNSQFARGYCNVYRSPRR